MAQKKVSASTTPLEEFLVDLYVRIEGKVWEQEAQFKLVKKSLLENVIHRPGNIDAELRKELARAMYESEDGASLRAAVAKFINVDRASRSLTLALEETELVAKMNTGEEAFRLPFPTTRSWKVGELDKFLVSEKKLAGTYLFLINGSRGDANDRIENMSDVTIKEVVAQCPREKRRPLAKKGEDKPPIPPIASVMVGSTSVVLKGPDLRVLQGYYNEDSKTGLPGPPDPEKGTDVEHMDDLDAITLLRQCVVGMGGHEQVLQHIDYFARDQVLEKLVRPDQGSNQGSGMLAHVFQTDPASVESIASEIITISSKLGFMARDRVHQKLGTIPSTQHLTYENNADRRESLLNTLAKEVQDKIRQGLRCAQRDMVYWKWYLVTYSRMRIICDIYQDEDLFVICEGWVRITDGVKGKLTHGGRYEVPESVMKKSSGQTKREESPENKDPLVVNHEGSMTFTLHLQVKAMTVNLEAVQEVDKGVLEIPVKDVLSICKRTSPQQQPFTRIQ